MSTQASGLGNRSFCHNLKFLFVRYFSYNWEAQPPGLGQSSLVTGLQLTIHDRKEFFVSISWEPSLDRTSSDPMKLYTMFASSFVYIHSSANKTFESISRAVTRSETNTITLHLIVTIFLGVRFISSFLRDPIHQEPQTITLFKFPLQLQFINGF